MQLHALQIPSGWLVRQNLFYDISPEAVTFDSRHIGFPYVEDILHLQNDNLRMALDLGWYPEGDSSGQYRLVLIQWDAPENHAKMPKQSITTLRNVIEYTYQLQPCVPRDAWSDPLVEFYSKSQEAIATQINQTLAKATSGHIGRPSTR